MTTDLCPQSGAIVTGGRPGTLICPVCFGRIHLRFDRATNDAFYADHVTAKKHQRYLDIAICDRNSCGVNSRHYGKS